MGFGDYMHDQYDDDFEPKRDLKAEYKTYERMLLNQPKAQRDYTAPYFHVKRDPLVCPGRDEHEFSGWREFEGGSGGETVCKHCGIGAMDHTLARDV